MSTANVLTINEAADRARVTPETIRRKVRLGQVKATKAFGRWRIPSVEIDRLLGLEPSSEVGAQA